MQNKILMGHLFALVTILLWGTTFISTKVLINHGLTPQEIFFYRFLIAYLGIWVISPKRCTFAESIKWPTCSIYSTSFR